MICPHCKQDKTPYHFFSFRGNYDKARFHAMIPDVEGLCFDCGGPYRCLICGEFKPASDYRLQGRVCQSCKTHFARVVTV